MSLNIRCIYSQLSFRVVRPQSHGYNVEILLLSCTEAELYLMSYLLSVLGRHLELSAFSSVAQYCH